MKRTTNRIQRNYMLAKAYLETLESIEADIERKYISDHGIINSDGQVPVAIYCIDDEDIFDKANVEFAETPEAKANFAELLDALENLKVAEDALIDFGLSIAPVTEREILRKACAENYTTRQKIINLVLRLDVTTVGA